MNFDPSQAFGFLASSSIATALVPAISELFDGVPDAVFFVKDAKAGLSPVKFARLLKRVLRLTPGQLILQTRLGEASRLLRDTDASIAEIATRCGFCDHSALTRAFHTTTGMTPSEFRRMK